MAKIIGNTTATPNPRPDWNQMDDTKADFIKNKLPMKQGVGENSIVANDVENNKSLVKNAVALGSNSIAGCKIFSYSGIDFLNKRIFLYLGGQQSSESWLLPNKFFCLTLIPGNYTFADTMWLDDDIFEDYYVGFNNGIYFDFTCSNIPYRRMWFTIIDLDNKLFNISYDDVVVYRSDAGWVDNKYKTFTLAENTTLKDNGGNGFEGFIHANIISTDADANLNLSGNKDIRYAEWRRPYDYSASVYTAPYYSSTAGNLSSSRKYLNMSQEEIDVLKGKWITLRNYTNNYEFLIKVKDIVSLSVKYSDVTAKVVDAIIYEGDLDYNDIIAPIGRLPVLGDHFIRIPEVPEVGEFDFGEFAIAQGNGALATAPHAFAVGKDVQASHPYATTIGEQLMSGKDHQVVVGNSNAVDNVATFVVADNGNVFTAGKDETGAYITIGDTKLSQIVQTTGDSKTALMSQKAITALLYEIYNRLAAIEPVYISGKWLINCTHTTVSEDHGSKEVTESIDVYYNGGKYKAISVFIKSEFDGLADWYYDEGVTLTLGDDTTETPNARSFVIDFGEKPQKVSPEFYEMLREIGEALGNPIVYTLVNYDAMREVIESESLASYDAIFISNGTLYKDIQLNYGLDYVTLSNYGEEVFTYDSDSCRFSDPAYATLEVYKANPRLTNLLETWSAGGATVTLSTDKNDWVHSYPWRLCSISYDYEDMRNTLVAGDNKVPVGSYQILGADIDVKFRIIDADGNERMGETWAYPYFEMDGPNSIALAKGERMIIYVS